MGMSSQRPFSGDTKVEGTLSIAALRPPYAVAFFAKPAKRASARPSGVQTALRVRNLRPPETVRFTSGVDTSPVRRGRATPQLHR